MTQEGKKVNRTLFQESGCYKLGALKQQRYSLTVLEARSLSLACQQSHAPSETPEKNSSLPLPSLGCGW